MNKTVRTNLINLHAEDRVVQGKAFTDVLKVTDKPVTWAYEVWDELLAMLTHPDNHQRAIAAQVLCNLAKSDPEHRMLKDFAALLAVTKDDRFVTARHCLQALWKVGIAGETQQQVVIAGLTDRFAECVTEKNCTLIRYDILKDLRQIYDVTHTDTTKATALALIETEADLKYRKKYATLWRTA